MSLNYPAIDPVIYSIGILKLSWYSLSYIVGIIIGYYYVLKLNKTRIIALDQKLIADSISYMVLGIIIGGRLGYVMFYKPEFYLANPMEIFRTWNGGMSFHGAVLGVVFSIYLFARAKKVSFLYYIDYIAAAAPIGFFFGRIANFINDELWGRVTNVPWAVAFPRGGYIPRHPSQIYEALLEGLLLFIVLNLLFKTKYRNYRGFIGSQFMIFYALFRIASEFFRQPDEQLGYIFTFVTMGQILSLPMILIGLFGTYYSIKSGKYEKQQ